MEIKFWLENKGPIKQQIIIPPENAAKQHEDFIQEHLEEQQKFYKRFYSWEKITVGTNATTYQ